MPLNFLARRRRTMLRGGGSSPIRSGFTPTPTPTPTTPDRLGLQPIQPGMLEKVQVPAAEEMHYGVMPVNPNQRKEKVMAGVPSGVASPGLLR